MTSPLATLLQARADALALGPTEIARRLGLRGVAVTPAGVGHWLAGRAVPEAGRLDAIGVVLEVAAADLVRAAGDVPRAVTREVPDAAE